MLFCNKWIDSHLELSQKHIDQKIGLPDFGYFLAWNVSHTSYLTYALLSYES